MVILFLPRFADISSGSVLEMPEILIIFRREEGSLYHISWGTSLWSLDTEYIHLGGLICGKLTKLPLVKSDIHCSFRAYHHPQHNSRSKRKQIFSSSFAITLQLNHFYRASSAAAIICLDIRIAVILSQLRQVSIPLLQKLFAELFRSPSIRARHSWPRS
jgi:hypothetical protein